MNNIKLETYNYLRKVNTIKKFIFTQQKSKIYEKNL